MKFTPFPVTPSYVYRLDSIPVADLASFEKQNDCPACGETKDPHPIALLGGNRPDQSVKLIACASCGHVTYDRLPSDAWLANYYGNVWDKNRRESDPKDFKISTSPFPPWGLPWQHVLDLNLPKDAHILDFGCGFGNGMLSLQNAGYTNLHGVEMGTHRVAVAERYFPGRIRRGTVPEAQAIAAESGKFDLVVLHHVIEHVREPYPLMKSLLSLLKPNGILCIAVPEVCSESPIHLSLYFPHLHHFNTTSLMRMMKRAGLTPHRWQGSKPQLAVVGCKDKKWQPPAGAFSTKEVTIDDAFIRDVSGYVTAPFEGDTSEKEMVVSYQNPAYHPDIVAGFQRLATPVRWWLRLAGVTIFPLIARSHQRRGYNAFLRAGRKLFGKGGPVSSEMLGFKVSQANTGGNLPWVTTDSGALPVLVK